MNSPAAICRQLEERDERLSRVGRIDLAGHAAALERRRSRSSIPLTPTPELVREAEMEAAEAQHALAMADPSCPAERRDELSRFADVTRARAHRLRLEDD